MRKPYLNLATQIFLKMIIAQKTEDCKYKPVLYQCIYENNPSHFMSILHNIHVVLSTSQTHAKAGKAAQKTAADDGSIPSAAEMY